MIVDSEILDLTPPERFFAFARAYQSAAAVLCQQMASDPEASNWPNASVVLFLAGHALELFLKGVIYHRDPSADLRHHRIDALVEEYSRYYPDESFTCSIPFTREYLGFAAAEIHAMQETAFIPSIHYRYPVDRIGEERKSVQGFVPLKFLETLERMQNDFDRIQSAVT